jgi:hypothetical protein
MLPVVSLRRSQFLVFSEQKNWTETQIAKQQNFIERKRKVKAGRNCRREWWTLVREHRSQNLCSKGQFRSCKGKWW